MTAVRILVSGRVQGVGFRAWAMRQARDLGLKGFARNLSDGRVEIIAGGAGESIDAMIERCRSGPSAAQVAAVETVAAPDEAWPDFSFRPTP